MYKMKNSEDIKTNIAGKFANNLYRDVKELLYDLDILCKQVVKEQKRNVRLFDLSDVFKDEE